MNKKFVWLITSCLMVAALVLASCAPTVVEEKKATVVTKEPEKKAEEVEEVVKEEGPQYGGMITTFYEGMPGTFDREDIHHQTDYWINPIYDSLLAVDWWMELPNRKAKLNGVYDGTMNPQLYTGRLAESWDWSDPLTMSFKLREGVRWTNGREFVADDVVWEYERLVANPKRAGQLITNIESVTATGKYTVVFKLKEPNVEMLVDIAIYPFIECQDVFEQYGNLRDWQTLVGTGPWIFEDVVPDSVAIFRRNPDYFVNDPDGNQIPYADKFRQFVILDPSTQIAALRTGKIDKTFPWNPVPWDQKASLEKTNPDMQFAVKVGSSCWNLWLKTTKEPTSNLKVRQALSMVVKRQELCDSLLGGTGHPFSWPIHSSHRSYIPIEELPEEIRQIYEWKPENVDKAKQLLAEAGYPNGFEISAQYHTSAAFAPFAQGMELLKAYWAEIGVILELRPVDAATDAYLRNYPFAYDDLLGTGGGIGSPLSVIKGKYISEAPWNRARVFNAVLDELYVKAAAEFDADKQDALYKELGLLILGQAYDVAFPRIDAWTAWQPWLKGYSGELALSYKDEGHIVARIWVDQDLKKSMGK